MTAKNGWQTIPFPSGEVSLRPSENMGFNSLTREQIWFKQPGREIFLSWKILIGLLFPKDRAASPTGLSEDPFLRLFVLPAHTGVALICMSGGDSPPAPPHPCLREGGEKTECEQLSSCVFCCFVFVGNGMTHELHTIAHIPFTRASVCGLRAAKIWGFLEGKTGECALTRRLCTAYQH